MDLKIKDVEKKYHATSNRLEVILSSASYIVFALDLDYHKTCYDNFAYAYDKKQASVNIVEKDRLSSGVMDSFFHLFHCMVIKDPNAYFMKEQIEDIKVMSEDSNLEDQPITITCMLKKCLIKKFGGSINFHIFGNRLVVHSSAVYPNHILQL